MIDLYLKMPSDGTKESILYLCASEEDYLIYYVKECEENRFDFIRSVIFPDFPEEKRTELLLNAFDCRANGREEKSK